MFLSLGACQGLPDPLWLHPCLCACGGLAHRPGSPTHLNTQLSFPGFLPTGVRTCVLGGLPAHLTVGPGRGRALPQLSSSVGYSWGLVWPLEFLEPFLMFPHHILLLSVCQEGPPFLKTGRLLSGGSESQSQAVMLMSMQGNITAELIAFWTDVLDPSPAPGFSTELGAVASVLDVPESSRTVVSWEVSGGGGLPEGGRGLFPGSLLPQGTGSTSAVGATGRWGRVPERRLFLACCGRPRQLPENPS